MIEDGGEATKGAGGAGESEEGDEDGGVHDMFAEIFLFGGQAEAEEDESESGGDKGGVVGGAGKEEAGQAEEDVGEGEADGEVGHVGRVGDSGDGEKNVYGWGAWQGKGSAGR